MNAIALQIDSNFTRTVAAVVVGIVDDAELAGSHTVDRGGGLDGELAFGSAEQGATEELGGVANLEGDGHGLALTVFGQLLDGQGEPVEVVDSEKNHGGQVFE